MGLLGIITKVTLQCVPAFHIEERLEHVSLDDCIQQLPTIATSGEYVTLWTEVYSDTCAVVRGNRTENSISGSEILRTLSWKVSEFSYIPVSIVKAKACNFEIELYL